MARFLDTHNTASEINNVIKNAQGWLEIVSPYLSVSPILLERLQDAGSRNVQIRLVYGKEELKPNELEQLKTVKNIHLWFYENVHAKCYCNQDSAVITSMNMYEFSEKNNREMGVLLQRQTDIEAYNEACAEIQSIIRSSTRKHAASYQTSVPPRTHSPTPESSVNRQNQSNAAIGDLITGALKSLFGEKGYCVRCGDRIDIDTNHPLCGDCYKKWNEYKNPNYVEKFCHSCGKEKKTTKERPLCKSCFAKT